MQYTFDSYQKVDGKYVRVSTDSNPDAAFALIGDSKLHDLDWFVNIFDGLTGNFVTISEEDSFEEYVEARARASQWKGKDRRKATSAEEAVVEQHFHDLKAMGWTAEMFNGNLMKPQTQYYFAKSNVPEVLLPSKHNACEIGASPEFIAMADKLAGVDKNVKSRAAVGKPSIADVPPIGFLALGAAMSDGAGKYGRFNWRDTEVTASTFYKAMGRHLLAWYCGEEVAEDSGVHHLAHLMASCAIILDAQQHGVFTDDRDKRIPKMPAEHFWKLVKKDGK